ncbi:MAG: tetratricopeptide repeat protein [Gemmatimonadota bacterium]|nr:MAG: tetratricopeptide repeat protein [Gemmatimonadota bacterium]
MWCRIVSKKRFPDFVFVVFITMQMFLPFHASLAESELEKGVELYEKAQYEEAKVLFENYLATHPNHPEALYYIGLLEMDGTKSQKHFRTLWINHPMHPFADDALYAICQYHYAKGYYITAGKMLKNLVKNYPGSNVADDATYWAGSCQLAAEHPDSALSIWQKLLKDYPKSNMYDWAVLGIGDAYRALSKYNEACQEYHKIIDSPFSEELKCSVLYKLGNCYEQLGENATARKYFNTLIEQCPDSYERILISGREKKKPASEVEGAETYTVQVGAFIHKENALKLHTLLSGKGYETSITSKYKDDGELLHVVHVGSYSTREQAQNVAERLENEEGFQPHIVPKSTQ